MASHEMFIAMRTTCHRTKLVFGSSMPAIAQNFSNKLIDQASIVIHVLDWKLFEETKKTTSFYGD